MWVRHGAPLRNARALFLITGSEHEAYIFCNSAHMNWYKYHKCDQQRLRRACAFVQSCQGLAAHKLKVFMLMKTKAA